MAELVELPSGLRCAPLPERSHYDKEYCSGGHKGVNVQMGDKILMASQFEPWHEFDKLAASILPRLTYALRQRCCYPRCSPVNLHGMVFCSGQFRKRSCTNPMCEGVTAYKCGVMIDDNFEDHIDLKGEAEERLMQGLRRIAYRLSFRFIGNVRKDQVLKNTQAIFPDLVLTQPGQCNPDCIIEIEYPSREPLLPDMGRCASLASAYAQRCVNVTEHQDLSYDQNCIAQTIKSALFTRSGYSCLFSHNQAVFVKVTPNIRETRARTRVTHKVLVSREFRCDEHVSVFHGLLAMMLHANEASNSATEQKLRDHFRLLEAAERYEWKELVVWRSEREPRDGTAATSLGNAGTRNKHRASTCGGDESEEEESQWARATEFYPDPSFVGKRKLYRAEFKNELAILSNTDLIRIFVMPSEIRQVRRNVTVSEMWFPHNRWEKYVVKRWNGLRKTGLEYLRREIEVYKRIYTVEYDKEAWYDAVPRGAAICDYPKENSMLVTVRSGYDLCLFPKKLDNGDHIRSREGWKMKPQWYANGVKLTEHDKQEIERAANGGLRLLQQFGIIHCNPRPSKLRVQKLRYLKTRWGTEWHAWWIGLGSAKLVDQKSANNYKPVFRLGDHE